MALRLRYVAHSEIGLVRKNNQDSGFADDRFLVVADGMGGAAAGDLASAVAVNEVVKVSDEQHSEGIRPIVGHHMLEALAGIVSRANDAIADLVVSDPDLEGMGTTVTAAMVDDDQLALAHIGDSRAYLWRGGELTRLTHDHSWVQSLVDEGRISDAEAQYHPHRSLLLKVLNGQPISEPDLSMHELREHDRLLFCSDGLSGLVDDERIADRLTIPDLDDALDALVADAHDEGGIDNITVVLADVYDAGAMGTGTGLSADDQAASTAERHVLGAAAERQIPDVAEHTHRIDRAALQGGGARAGDARAGATAISADTAGSPATPTAGPDEDRRYQLQQLPSKGRRALRGVGLLLLVGLILAALGFGAIAWGRTQYFVGANADNRVAIFRGLSERFLGVNLNEVYEVEPIDVNDLPAFEQEQVRNTIDAADLQAARDTTDVLRQAADRCIAIREERARATASPRPSASPSPSQSSSC